MPQLSLYLDDPAMDVLRLEAKQNGCSLSKYTRSIIMERHEKTWPDGYFDLYGCIDDDSFEAPPELAWDTPSFSFDDPDSDA